MQNAGLGASLAGLNFLSPLPPPVSAAAKPKLGQALPDPPGALPSLKITDVKTILTAPAGIRFSSPEQRKGDSRRRQTADTERWCEANGIPLDNKLSCKDAGRSAYHGRHLDDDAALGQFLEVVKEGKVPRGSFLIIENLDRLSRQHERKALRTWLDILDAGINIVQLHPETVFRQEHEKCDMVDIMRAIIKLSRGHSESRMKSVRSLANWEKVLRLARAEGRPMTRRLPGWVELTENGLRLVSDRTVAVKRIFEMATAGYGMTTIVAKLTAEGVPAFGERELVEDEDGPYWQAVEGERYGCGEWRTAYVRSILSDRRALGEFQPCDSENTPKGDPIPDYFPAAVTGREFYAARAAIGKRTNKGSNTSKAHRQGRIGNGLASLFGGLLKHARNPGETYYVAAYSEKGVTTRVLLNSWSRERKATAYTFPYDTFERAVLSCLREIDPDEVVSPVPITEVSVLQGELNDLRERKVALALALRDVGNIAAVAAELKKVEDREQDLLAQIDDSAERVAVPRSDAWRTMQSLVDVLDTAEDREDVRLRLRAALRRNVDTIHVLVVPRGRERLCAVEIDFAEGGRRNYLIRRHPTAGAAKCGTERRRIPGWWQATSYKLTKKCATPGPIPQWTWVEMADGAPERGPEHWKGTEWYLTEMSAADLDLMFGDAAKHPLP